MEVLYKLGAIALFAVFMEQLCFVLSRDKKCDTFEPVPDRYSKFLCCI